MSLPVQFYVHCIWIAVITSHGPDEVYIYIYIYNDLMNAFTTTYVDIVLCRMK